MKINTVQPTNIDTKLDEIELTDKKNCAYVKDSSLDYSQQEDTDFALETKQFLKILKADPWVKFLITSSLSQDQILVCYAYHIAESSLAHADQSALSP